MNKAPAFQFYADDFIGGTITMSHEERGLYVLALCIQWGQGSLAHDDIERLGSGMAQPSLSKVKAKFELGEDGRLRQHRMEKERLKQASYRAERSESGKKGAKSKWANGSANGSDIKQPMAQPMANAWPPSPSPSPSPSLVSATEPDSFQPEIHATGQAPNDAQRKKTLRRENAKMLLDFLNETAGRSFRATDTNLDLIVARLSEPDVTPEGCEAMIERQVALWKGTETEEYLQPSTLFGKQKFGGYYDKRELPVKLETKGNCL